MKGRDLFATLFCVSALAFCASRSLSKKHDSTRAQKVETPMATGERLEASGWWPTKRTASLQDFAGTPECTRCHAKIAETQLATPMARAASAAVDSIVLREHSHIERHLGAYTYTISPGGGAIVYTVSAAVASFSEPLAWAFGLGNKGQTFVYQHEGQYYESRISFYKTLQGLDLTTGHSNKPPGNLEDAAGRFLDPDSLRHCFGCHTTASTTSAGFDTSHLSPGVNCEACHGPGVRHAELMYAEKKEEGRQAIFNPGRLNPVALVDFCGACHRTLNDVYEMGVTGVANVRFQPYRLENSRCWSDGDARLACTACHDPHKQLVREAGTYDEKCLACHVLPPVTKVSPDHPGKACPVAKKDCVTCHMPRVEVQSMHAPFVDHRIRIVRAKEKYPD
jgi:cytochrome c554/c'-like protein